jgi:hypothetical protein
MHSDTALICALCKLLLDAGRQRLADAKSRESGLVMNIAEGLRGGERSFYGAVKGRWEMAIPGPEGSDKSVMKLDKGGVYMHYFMLPKEVTSNEVVRDSHRSNFAAPATSDQVEAVDLWKCKNELSSFIFLLEHQANLPNTLVLA